MRGPLLLVLLVALMPLKVEASACNEVIVAHISMGPGSVCWRYHGTATTFVGAFGGRQRIVAHMRGQAAEADAAGRIRYSIQDRQPEASGPNGFFVGGQDGVLAFTTPGAGTYRFSFSPCAMWGAPGTVEICAR